MAYKKCDLSVAEGIGYWDWLTAWVPLPLVQWHKLDQQLGAKRSGNPSDSVKSVKTKYRVERRKYDDAMTE